MLSPETQKIENDIPLESEPTSPEVEIVFTGLISTIKSWKNNLIKGMIETAETDSEFYEHAGRVSLSVQDPKPPYDPLKDWEKNHRTRRAVYGEVPKVVEEQPSPRNRSQERSVTRSNLRVDSLSKHKYMTDRYERLYADFHLSDRVERIMSEDRSGILIPRHDRRALQDELKEELSKTRTTSAQRSAVQSAGKQILKSKRSSRRAEGRLMRTRQGNDIPGLAVSSRIKVLKKLIS